MNDQRNPLFAPPGQSWRRVSPRYRTMRLMTSAIALFGVTAAGASAVRAATGQWWPAGVVAAVGAVVLALRLVAVQRTARSWGYVERPTDLWITHGVLYRRLVAVPYGRMQLVEVTSGPLQRAFGLATVQLRTAHPATGARIPGVAPTEAARLRDRLTERGREQAVAL